MLYLVAYPFECAEQLSSRILAIAALKDVLAAFQAEGLPKPEEIEAAVKRDVERLARCRTTTAASPSGAAGTTSWPYVASTWRTPSPARRRRASRCPTRRSSARARYLRDIERHIPRGTARTRGARSWPTRSTCAQLHGRSRRRAGARARARGRRRRSCPSRRSAGCCRCSRGTRARRPRSRPSAAASPTASTETAGAAHFAVSYGDGAHLLLHSDRRADAILLEALIADQPENDLIPKLVAGLLAHRKAGRWLNTQENAFVLLALDRYFHAYEKVTPDFVARVWLGERFAGEHAFRGRTTERQHVAIPMADLPRGTGAQDLLLAKEGPGRLYYRIGMQLRAGEPRRSTPLDRGFTVERALRGRRRPERRQPRRRRHVAHQGRRARARAADDGRARRGATTSRSSIRCPAGLEAHEPGARRRRAPCPTTAAATSTSSVRPASAGRGARALVVVARPWYEHQNMRDERVEAFASLLWEGVYSYSYVARATTPGTFVVPPPKAEEMYAPRPSAAGRRRCRGWWRARRTVGVDAVPQQRGEGLHALVAHVLVLEPRPRPPPPVPRVPRAAEAGAPIGVTSLPPSPARCRSPRGRGSSARGPRAADRRARRDTAAPGRPS